MKRRVVVVLAAAVVAVLAHAYPLAAAPHYSVAVSNNIIDGSRLHLFAVGDPAFSQAVLYQFGPGAAKLADVAVKERYIFVADSAANSLHILQVYGFPSAPQAELIKTVKLPDSMPLDDYTTVAVANDGGGVYVCSNNRFVDASLQAHSYYAYVTPGAGGWADASAQIVLFNEAIRPNVAAVGVSGAILAHTGTMEEADTFNLPVRVTGLDATSFSNPPAKPFQGNPAQPSNPRGVAVNTAFGSEGYAYIISANDAGFPPDGTGGLTVVNAATRGAIGSPIALPDHFNPVDIATFAFGGGQYLAIVGKGDYGGSANVQQVWRIQLSSGGLPIFGDGLARYIIPSGDQAAEHYLGASYDGELLWVSNSLAGTVFALDNNSNWGVVSSGHFSIPGATTRYICDYFVPEPSCLTALSIFGLGTIGLVKLRRPRR